MTGYDSYIQIGRYLGMYIHAKVAFPGKGRLFNHTTISRRLIFKLHSCIITTSHPSAPCQLTWGRLTGALDKRNLVREATLPW